jgi:tetratricopeptide (TPR) repeat protein
MGFNRKAARLGAALCVSLLLALRGAAGQQPGPSESLARIASLQNQVETRPATDTWSPSSLNQALHERYRVRTGPASRAGILYADETLHRLNEKSEIEILGPAAERPGLISILFGTHYFSSRAPKTFQRIETPAVTAAIRGTEFVVDVAVGAATRITMLDGVVEASNPQGSVTVQSGEEAYAEPGKAPVKRIVVRPRDAVSWALYYPPVLGGADATRLRDLGAEGEDLARAAVLLSAGQVDQAGPLIESARKKRPTDPIALALASVIELVTGEKEKALKTAQEASAADPRSPAGALALSFAAQAFFDIPRARAQAERAAEADPGNSLALSRVAELRMAEGDLRGAEEAARKAVERSPGEWRALAVLGFVKLAQFRSEEAEGFLQRAVEADPSAGLARVGLGLARIRRGKVEAGREELQTAVVLDPNDSLLRSYLGKAYYEEKRAEEAGKELALAKQLDPADPTPYLYDAIRKQNENSPAEALEDLRAAIERNDNRAVYRSRLLLDEDRAVRGADLARIYNDLGFGALGLVAARRSADQDQSSYSSHLFLAGGYRTLPEFAPAFLSEVLQARIYQPVSVNAARPDVVNEIVSFNEYTALFDRPRLRGFGSAGFGVTDDNLDEVVPSDLPEDSEIHTGDVTGTLNGDRFAGALAYQRFTNDGFRVNDDQAFANYRGFFEIAATARDSFQVNALVSRQRRGDIPLRYQPQTVQSERFDTDLRNIGLGYHHVLRPGADLAVSVIHNRTEQRVRFTDPLTFMDTEATGVLEGPQVEVQQVLRGAKTTWVLGAGGFRGEARLSPEASPTLETDDTFANAYAYFNARPWRPLEFTVGAAWEDVVAPTGLQTPRDANIGSAELEFDESRVSPKLGLSFFPSPKTVLRGALYYRLSPAIGRIQTLEPTQVAGFNQFFSEPGGTRSRSYGVGLDQEFTSRFFGGFSLLRRRLQIPEAFCSGFDPVFLIDRPDPDLGCAFATANVVEERESRDRYASAYLNALLGTRVAVALDYSYLEREFDFTEVTNLPFTTFENRQATHRVRPQVRMFLRSGWFATVSANYFDQVIDLRDAYDPPNSLFGTPDACETLGATLGEFCRGDFWIVDLSVGYRFPRRYGSVVAEARNLTNKEFKFFERAVEDTIVPAREVALTLRLAY